MHAFHGSTPTQNASRVMKRLCRHWSHKFPVTFDDERGVIELNNVRCSMQAYADHLDVTLESEAEVPERLRGVVAEHLQRMAGEETLALVWRD